MTISLVGLRQAHRRLGVGGIRRGDLREALDRACAIALIEGDDGGIVDVALILQRLDPARDVAGLAACAGMGLVSGHGGGAVVQGG